MSRAKRVRVDAASREPSATRLERDEQAGHAVLDDLGDAAGRGRDDRRLAGHRLEVDDAQRLVDRRADEHGRVAEELDHARAAAASRSIQTTSPRVARARALDLGRDLGRDLRRVGRAGAEHELGVRVDQRARRRAGGRAPFWRVIRPTKTTDGPVRVDAVALEHVGAAVGPVLARCRCRCGSRCTRAGSIAG